MDDAAFRHHPELRGRIADPLGSPMRALDLADIDRQLAEAGIAPGWRLSCRAREGERRAFLDALQPGPLWVFGYGSLMWDPAIRFDLILRAHAPGHARRFCLWDDKARGTREAPGLMAALDRGDGCSGIAFRVPEAARDEETFFLWRRERIGPGYRPAMIRLGTAQGAIVALAFLADFETPALRRDLPLAAQAAMIARASGMIGTNRAYLENVATQLGILGIEDAEIAELQSLVASARAGPERNPGR